MHDLRYALRTLGGSPGFAALVLLTLGIGIGASTAVFSAVNEVMLRPLAMRDPGRLVMLWESNQERGWHQVQVAPANALDWRERVGSFVDVALVNESVNSLALSGGTDAVQVTVSQVSGNTFSVLGAAPLLGRTFTFDETWAESEATVVLSHAAWLKYFASDTGVVGRTIRLDGVPFAIVGVLRPGFGPRWPSWIRASRSCGCAP